MIVRLRPNYRYRMTVGGLRSIALLLLGALLITAGCAAGDSQEAVGTGDEVIDAGADSLENFFVCYRVPCTPPEDPSLPKLEATLDPDLSQLNYIDELGGMLYAFGADGSEIRLTFPPGALAGPQEIKVTPITALLDGAADELFITGVHLEPEGLALFKPALLEVEVPGRPSDGVFLAVGSDGDGARPFAMPPANSPATFSTELMHFSNYSFVAPPAPGSDSAAYEGFESDMREWQVGQYGDPVAALQHALGQVYGEYWGTVENPFPHGREAFDEAFITAIERWLPLLEQTFARAEGIVSADPCGGLYEIGPLLVTYLYFQQQLQSDSRVNDYFTAQYPLDFKTDEFGPGSYETRLARIVELAYQCERERCRADAESRGVEECECANFVTVIRTADMFQGGVAQVDLTAAGPGLLEEHQEWFSESLDACDCASNPHLSHCSRVRGTITQTYTARPYTGPREGAEWFDPGSSDVTVTGAFSLDKFGSGLVYLTVTGYHIIESKGKCGTSYESSSWDGEWTLRAYLTIDESNNNVAYLNHDWSDPIPTRRVSHTFDRDCNVYHEEFVDVTSFPSLSGQGQISADRREVTFDYLEGSDVNNTTLTLTGALRSGSPLP